VNPVAPLSEWVCRNTGLSADRLSRQQLEQYQGRMLSETLRHAAANSAFYRQRLAGTAIGEITSPAQLSTLPFTTEDDLQKNGPAMLCLSQSEISRVVTLDSSGTVGLPKRLWFTAAEQEQTADFFRAGMSLLVRPGDRTLILLPGERPGSVGDLLARSLQAMGVASIVQGPLRCLADTLRRIEEQQVTALVATPVQALALVRYAAAVGMKPTSVHSVLLSTDYAATSLVNAVRTGWSCRVFDHYGMTEMGLGGGVECALHNGFHLREVDLLFEIVDPDSGEPVADGCEGEVVFTTLTRRGMPLIRYRSGDLSRMLPGPCRCGSVLKRLDKIRSRRQGMLKLPTAGTLCLADVDEVLFAVDGVIDYSLEVVEHAASVRLQIGLLVVGAVAAAQSAAMESLEAMPQLAETKQCGRLELAVCAEPYAGSLPVASGKRKIRRR
jgi:phenylacetate-coenzyme A ligase PaaK-like adenylate-forming protein